MRDRKAATARGSPSKRGPSNRSAAKRPGAAAPSSPAPLSGELQDLQRSVGNRAFTRRVEGDGASANLSVDREPAIVPPEPILKLGSRGAGVAAVQQLLNTAVNPDPALVPDGVFGSLTATAVRTFQRSNGLEPDGIIGPNTRAALSGEGTTAKDSPPATTQAKGASFPKKQFTRNGAFRPFNSTYDVVGPAPEKGKLTINLNVHVRFTNFNAKLKNQEPYKSHNFTPEQLADFEWTDDEKEKFKTDFASAVETAWSEKHEMVLTDPTLAPHRASVHMKVNFVESAAKANNRMEAKKIPKGAPRFRSSASTESSTLEIRDPTETEARQVRDRPFIRQIRGFANDSDEVNAGMRPRIAEVSADLKKLNPPLGPQTEPDGTKRDWHLVFQGWATKAGAEEYNADLAERRAKTIKDEVNAQVGRGDQGRVLGTGERNTTNESKYRRVDVIVTDLGGAHEVVQNTAAHEAGHMFGLGDEYVEEDASDAASKKFMGDEPSHFGDVEAQLGTDAANELVNQNSGSMMSNGSDVKRGHYVYFLIALEKMTRRQWTVE